METAIARTEWKDNWTVRISATGKNRKQLVLDKRDELKKERDFTVTSYQSTGVIYACTMQLTTAHNASMTEDDYNIGRMEQNMV